MTGIEIMKLGYWIVKYLGFPLFALIYGFDFKHYEIFLDRHFDYVLMVTFGSGIAVVDAIQDASKTISMQSSIESILIAVLIVFARSFLGAIASGVGAWFVRVTAPFFKKKWDSIKKWFKKL